VQGRSDGPVVDASTGETPAARATPEESHVELIRELARSGLATLDWPVARMSGIPFSGLDTYRS